jgi:hypothetical protein
VRDPLAPLAQAGIVEPGSHGWRLTEAGERRYGWALRELHGRCLELEQAGCPWREWSLTLALREAGQQAAEPSG